ncbi:BEM_collapsed_G0007540.mRNA.1.CDS.1 [Saccharomyces cerevisiae]|nr:BEM_HP_G0084630.mRNA.1.CDS.1 [Saccharomyces cerevisiae]CAI6996175.1 BEM_HP_G0084630.mRNA.1.CDS.1 [Saccharomyces cerevisiae]CAI7062147.1 BEM_collapsed_G0007540.mRNA.1.CDS.1 [Saccharomyces cerevisiae]
MYNQIINTFIDDRLFLQTPMLQSPISSKIVLSFFLRNFFSLPFLITVLVISDLWGNGDIILLLAHLMD